MADEFDPDAYLGATATAPPPEFDPNQYLGIEPAGVAPPMLAAPEGVFPKAIPVIPTALGATGFPYPQQIQPPLSPPETPPTAAAEPDWTTGVGHYGGPMDLPEPTGEDFRGPFTSGAVQAAAKKAAETGLSYGPPILAARKLLPPENPIRQFAEATIGAGGQLASGLTSNENLAITAALIPTAGTAAAPLISNVFAAQMLSQAPELWQAFKDAPDFKSKVSVAEQAVGTLVLAGTAAAHGILGETAVPGAVGPARPQAEAPPPLEPPPTQIPPEYLRPVPPVETAGPPAVEAPTAEAPTNPHVESRQDLDKRAQDLGYTDARQFNTQNVLKDKSQLSPEEQQLLVDIGEHGQRVSAERDPSVIAGLSDEDYNRWQKVNAPSTGESGGVTRGIDVADIGIRAARERGDTATEDRLTLGLKLGGQKADWTIESWKEVTGEDADQAEIDDRNKSAQEHNDELAKTRQSLGIEPPAPPAPPAEAPPAQPTRLPPQPEPPAPVVEAKPEIKAQAPPTAQAKYQPPSLGDTGQEIYQGMVKAASGPNVPPRSRFVAQVVGGPAFDFREGKPVVLENKGRTYRDATPAEEQELHDAIQKGTVQAEYRSTTGGTISGWTRAESPEDYRLLHQATGKPLEPSPVAAGVSPAKNDIVTVSLGGREYPKTRITNVVQTPEGTRYQVDVFGQKFVPAEQIVSVDQPSAPQPTRLPPQPEPPAPVIEAKPEIKAQAKAVAKAPETAPQKMRVQKAYLLDALDKAHKDAGEAAAPIADADAQRLEATSPYRHGSDYYSADEATKQGFHDQRVADLAPLIQKYGLTDYRYREPAQTIYSMSGAPEFHEAVDRPATYEELMSELKNRIGEARAKEIPKITIEVPGDGTFDIVNTKEAIAKFRDEARKRFPTTLARAKEPGIGGRVTPEPIPAVGKPKTREDYIKIAGRAASQDETRFVLHKTVASTGDELVATDGRRLIRIDYKGPTVKETVKGKGKGKQVEVTKPAIFDADTGKPTKYKEKQEGNYPNWKQVVPDTSKLAPHKKVATADTGALMKLLTQAEQVMGERTQSVKLWMDDKGKLGITASGPEIGEFAGGDANPNTAKFLAALNPEFLKDGLRIARQLGHEKVDLHYQDELAPIVLKAKGMEYVQMPMRIDSSRGGDYAAVHPAASAPEALRTRTRADVYNELRGGGSEQAIREMEDRGIPTDETKKYMALRDARLTMGRSSPPLADFEAALRSDLEKWNPDQPKPIAAPGTELGMGGTRQPRTQPLTETVAPNTADQLKQTVAAQTPGSGSTLSNIKNGLLQLVLPSARSPEHLRAAESLGAKLGPMHRRAEIANAALKPHERMFDKLGVDREGVAPADNKGTQFASAMSTGEPVPRGTERAAETLKQQFDSRLKALRDAGAPLQAVRENYFPGMWTRDSRLAFNAALDEAMQQGVIPREGFNVNEATPEQRAWVKARVDDNLAKGVGSEKDMLPYLSRNPLRGKESFRKPKVFDDIMDAQEFGLRPASNNPITLAKVKLAEMDRSIMAHQYFQELKNKGLLQVTSPYEQPPPGMVRISDPYGTIYGPPTVQLHEYVDKAVYQGLADLAEKLGIQHERGYGIGGSRLGYSVVGGQRIVTRYATETSVLAHELGHQLDERYGLWDRLEVPTKYGAGKTPVEKELRAIADMTERGRYARKKAEKIAQVIEAYVHAPDKMREVAPTVFDRFDNFVRSRPELKELADIQPNIALQKLTSEKYVGLPIMGYRVVPEAHGDILNNYLSSSLYNNPYFGDLYKGWMGAASTLNQAQLGVGSAFHAGFTAADVQVSAGANFLKDVYGVLRGNRSVSDAIGSAGKTATAIVRTPILGDRVLNEWRNPQAPLDSKIAAVTKAAELAGGGFQMERGLMTEQSAKVRSDWYSGHRIRAALRSPVAATEMMARPIMNYLVPRQKAGVFAELASRIIEQNPGKSLEELTPQFRQAWNRVDARLGQVMYDRLFINNVAKNVMQGTMRAPGWTGGTIAELGGAFPDTYRFFKEWAQTGRPPAELPDRVAYTASLLMGTMIVNGALTYAFTGQRPHGMDYFAFRDGGKDEYGNETRMVLPTYMKDILAYARAPLHTLAAKTHPLINAVNELMQNKNYYGVEIRHPDDPLYKQGLQLAGYVAHQFQPFWIRGAQQQAQKAGGGPGKYIAPYFGVMPAPRAVTESSAQRQAREISQAQAPVGGRTAEQAQRSLARHQAIRDIAAGTTTAHQAQMEGRLARGQASEAVHLARMTPLQRQIFGFGAEDAVRVWNKADESERGQIYRMVRSKIDGSRVLTNARKRELLQGIGAAPVR